MVHILIRYVEKYGFWDVLRICFENYGYNDDDLGAPSMWFQLGKVTPLDGAAPMEGPPLGGEGYQWEVNSLIENVLHFVLSREKRAIR
jgi:hypothetical protein